MGLLQTSVDDFLSKAQSSNFSLCSGKHGLFLRGIYLNEDVEVIVNPSSNNEISEMQIFFSSTTDIKSSVVLCNNISEEIEGLYGSISNTYFFDTDKFSKGHDREQLKLIRNALLDKGTATYDWLFTCTEHEEIMLSIVKVDICEENTNKEVYGPILTVKVKQYSHFPKIDVFFGRTGWTSLFTGTSFDSLNPKTENEFLKSYLWNRKNSFQLISPCGILEPFPKHYKTCKEDIFRYSEKIQKSYFMLQNDFISGIFYDLSDDETYAQYAFILFFTILDAFRYNLDKDMLNFIDQLDILCACCPKIRDYIYFIMEPKYKIWDYFNDSLKIMLLDKNPNLKLKLSLYDYARLVLRKCKNDADLLKNITIDLSLFTISKTNEKRYHISNEIIIQDFIEIFILLLKRIGGMEAFIYKFVKQKCIGKRDPFDDKEKAKLTHIYREKMKNLSFEELFYKCQKIVYRNNGIPKELSFWGLVTRNKEFNSFNQYFEEIEAEYYFKEQHTN